MNRYYEKSKSVGAIQYTKGNCKELCEWVVGFHEDSYGPYCGVAPLRLAVEYWPRSIYGSRQFDCLIVNPGDWVVSNLDGDLVVMDDTTFKSLYEMSEDLNVPIV